MGDCVDAGVDDVGFLERVMQSVQSKYSGAGKLFVSGNSAGGMMVYELLCESEWFAKHLTAASVFSGGMGDGFGCRNGQAASRVPLLVLHGQDDDVIGYRKGTSVDGSPFQAVVDTIKGWAERRGCGADGEALAAPFFGAQKIECRDYCRRPQGVSEVDAAADAGAGLRVAGNGNAAAGAAKNAGKNAGKEGLDGGASKNAAAAAAAPVAAAAATKYSPVAAATKNSPVAAAAKNAPVAAAAKNAPVAAAAAANGAKYRESGSVAKAAPMRACSVPGMKHNLYNVVRSFPIDVSAAWFAKHAGPSWGATPPS
jgi:hypothetical protein